MLLLTYSTHCGYIKWMLSQNLACMGGFVTRTLVHMDLVYTVRIRSSWSCRVLFAVASSVRDFQCPSIRCSWRYGLGSLGTDAPARWQSCGCLLWSPPVPAWAHLSLGPGLRGRGRGGTVLYIYTVELGYPWTIPVYGRVSCLKAHVCVQVLRIHTWIPVRIRRTTLVPRRSESLLSPRKAWERG